MTMKPNDNNLAELVKRSKSPDPQVAEQAKAELEQVQTNFNSRKETRLAGENAERRTA